MKVLVTGGAGYIGTHTCLALLRQGMEVVVVDNLSNSHPVALKRVEALAGKDIPFYEGDVCDETLLDRIFTEHAIDCVIHFAGLKAVGESVVKPLAYYENNLISTLHLLSAMARHDVKRIIFSSSATVYRSDSPMPVDETAPLGCLNPYGWTKLMCEQILRDAVVADDKLSVVLLRYFNPIGADASGDIGEDPDGIPNNLVPYVAQTALGIHPHVNVFGDDYNTPDGTGVRDYIHVTDLADGHVAAIAYAEKHTGCEAFNLGTGIGYSVLDIISTFEKANRIKVPYVIGPRRPGDADAVYSNPEKARKLLKWEAKKTLTDMCRDSWNWQQKNPRGYRTGEE